MFLLPFESKAGNGVPRTLVDRRYSFSHHFVEDDASRSGFEHFAVEVAHLDLGVQVNDARFIGRARVSQADKTHSSTAADLRISEPGFSIVR